MQRPAARRTQSTGMKPARRKRSAAALSRAARASRAPQRQLNIATPTLF